MNKSDIVDALHKKLKKYKKSEIKKVVDGTFEAMIDALKNNDRIEIRGLGSFKVKEINSKLARNPKTGEKIEIPERKTVHFKMGKVLKNALFKIR